MTGVGAVVGALVGLVWGLAVGAVASGSGITDLAVPPLRIAVVVALVVLAGAGASGLAGRRATRVGVLEAIDGS